MIMSDQKRRNPGYVYANYSAWGMSAAGIRAQIFSGCKDPFWHIRGVLNYLWSGWALTQFPNAPAPLNALRLSTSLQPGRWLLRYWFSRRHPPAIQLGCALHKVMASSNDAAFIRRANTSQR